MSVTVRANQRTTLMHEALDAYLVLARSLHQANIGAWVRLDFSLTELKALMAVAQKDRPSISGLAALLQVSRPEASRATDQLYRRGLITRVEDRADRRRSLLGLTAAGQDLVAALLLGDPAALAGAVARLELADLQQLVQGLRALLAVPPSICVRSEISAAAPSELVPRH
jgi:DNA-binding MarR family transcriptional regulator